MMCKTALLLLVFIATASNASTDMQTYIVHMDKTKMAAPDQSAVNSKELYESVIESLTKLLAEVERESEQQASPQLIHVYKQAISGFAAKLSTKQLESLKRLDGFLSASPDEMLSLHTTRSPQFLGLEPGKGLWSASNLKSDVIIGVVDSGIWPEHVSFDDEGIPPVPTRWKAGDVLASYCVDGSLKKKMVKRKIVVCQRGINSRAAKGEQVKLAGGAGMLMINTEGEGEELFADAHILPATSLGATAGKAIKNVTFKRTVTHVGISNVTYVVQKNEPTGVSVVIKPQILKFQKPGQKLSYKITFTQNKGLTVQDQDSSFGYIQWVYSNTYHVRSSIAVTWT
ncbi:hypothetical protein V6N11_037172 [Hibiscus sabdariffa]|uniref:Uncharacterized protein n=1 Tax=Hibiscus sabdariffa TaxID=183260 RepID=A0ABR2P0J1_9ROSI